jgi:uncharacterized low-complexity protein
VRRTGPLSIAHRWPRAPPRLRSRESDAVASVVSAATMAAVARGLPWPWVARSAARVHGRRRERSVAVAARSAPCRCGEVQFAVGTRSAAAMAVVARGPSRSRSRSWPVLLDADARGCGSILDGAFCSIWSVLLELVQHRRSSRVSASTASCWARTHMQRVGASSSGLAPVRRSC